ncbi:hypothetical protein [Dyadobacter pollutisoli]|uniref:Uncharacterized protein n=1 Tax=Dyadobacter pollutisoli TaxID=2910158 RepID=A0A9E8NEV8_9BACT|nr:hypothetical protein [Dyadobacter pollutisoli]WAC14678.1 hypothetical protein ON006_12095 [Dyadobacter pollutisoli]
MRQILCVLVIAMMLAACKKDRNDDPLPEIASIAGKWRMTEVEKTENGKTSWYPVVYYDSPVYITFRFDGVILDNNGLPYCCGPDSLKINGVPFEIVPKADLPANPSCAFVDCATCPTWEITQSGDEMIVGACTTFPKYKYVRE